MSASAEELLRWALILFIRIGLVVSALIIELWIFILLRYILSRIRRRSAYQSGRSMGITVCFCELSLRSSCRWHHCLEEGWMEHKSTNNAIDTLVLDSWHGRVASGPRLHCSKAQPRSSFNVQILYTNGSLLDNLDPEEDSMVLCPC